MTARLSTWLLSGLLALTGMGCSTNNEPEPTSEDTSKPSPIICIIEGVKVRYKQTYCADRWGQASTTQQLETVATAYLAQQGITFNGAHATRATPAAVCNACTCTTGVVLEGEISPSQLAAIQALGFTKI
jgi:hypothetical protein